MATPIAQNFDASLHKAPWTLLTKEGMERIPRVHDSYMGVRPSSNAKEEELLYGGLPAVPRVANDQVRTPQVSFKMGSPVVYRHAEYRYQYIYTKVAADDDQYGVVQDVVGDMGEGAAFTMEQVAASVLNEGLNTNVAAGWDGLSLFNANHQLIDSTITYSNILAAGGPTYAAVHTIVAYFKRLLNDQGFWTPVEIESIQVAPELAPLWRQLLGALSAYNILSYTSGTGGGTVYGSTPAGTAQPNEGIANQARSMGMTPEKVVENHYLANAEDTIVIGVGKKLRTYMREEPNTDTYNLNDPKAIAHRIQMRFSVGFTDARRVLLLPGS